MNPVAKQTHVLEPSTNTHSMSAESIEVKHLDNGYQMLKIEGRGIVTHGEHGPIGTESKFVQKAVQKELNPITRLMQNAWD